MTSMSKSAEAGVLSALRRFKIANAPLPPAGPALLDRLKTFGHGQLAAAKSLGANLRGGFGGQMNPGLVEGPVPAHSMELARGSHRAMALGDLRSLAPSLAIGGGMYMLNRRGREGDDRRQQEPSAYPRPY